MKKILKSKIFIVIITLIIGTGLGVYGATKYQASEILYNGSDGTSMNVNDALNELYNKCGNSSSVPEPVSFAEDSWETIIANVKAGNTSAYRVGETKEIELTGFTNGEAGSNGLYTVRIANNSTPEECSTDGFSQTACGFVIEFVDIITTYYMNTTNTNVGGWQDSAMRTYVNDTIYNALSEELRRNIIDTYVVSGHGSSDTANFTATDKIYLLSTEEVWGSQLSYDTAVSETRQLDYYINLGISIDCNSSMVIKNYNGERNYWWLRSARDASDSGFYNVTNDGAWYTKYAHATSFCVAPAFRIG